ncbi:MAG TPA: glycosyltransferase family 4 protein, partial [Candidatus Woesebacteria bacterium]|nr:glycosyltransferase family 4 protein [Candidatus Woesebacteria bacterium]
MKIILASDYQNMIGGTEVYMWAVKRALEAKGHSVKIFGSEKTIEEYIKSQQTKTINRYLKKLFNISIYFQFRRLINEFKPNIIHFHNIYNELSPSVILAAGSIPKILTVHDTLLVNPVSILSERTGKDCKKRTCGGCMNCIGWKGMIYEYIRINFYRIFLENILVYATPSIYMKNFMMEAGFKNIEAIPNGIALLPSSKIINFNNLLYVGR